MAHVYCPECGYNNPEAAHFCARCGAALVVPEEGESTEAFTAPELPESLDPIEELGVHGAAVIVRSGGGRAGETFPVEDSPIDDRPLARMRHLPRRRHRVAQARSPHEGR